MSKITKLSAQKLDRSRVNIEIDGEFFTGLSLDEVVKLGIAVGQEVGESTLSSWKELDDKGKILGKVLNFLSYRPRTEREVVLRLRHYSDNQEAHAYVLAYLAKNALLDDHAFASWWVSSRKHNHSTRVLQNELRAKGISKDIIQEVLSNTQSDRVSLQALIDKKSNLERPKLYRYCLSKGYSYDLVNEAFHKLDNS